MLLQAQSEEEKEESELKREYEEKLKAIRLENLDLKSRNDLLTSRSMPRIPTKPEDPRKLKENTPTVIGNSESMVKLLQSMTQKITELETKLVIVEQKASPPMIVQEIARESSTFPAAVNDELYKISESSDKSLQTAMRIRRKVTNLFGHQTLTCLGKTLE